MEQLARNQRRLSLPTSSKRLLIFLDSVELGRNFFHPFRLDKYKHKHKVHTSPEAEIQHCTIIPLFCLANPLMGHRISTHIFFVIVKSPNKQQLQQPLPNPPTAHIFPSAKHQLNKSIHHSLDSADFFGK